MTTIDSRIKWFQETLNISDKEVSKLVRDAPYFLTRSTDNCLEPKLQWIKSRLELDDMQLSKLVRDKPQLFACIFWCSMEDYVQPKLLWLQERFDLNTTEALRSFVLSAPGALSLS